MNVNVVKFNGKVGAEIKRVRELKGYFQWEVSQMSGVSQSEISRVEAGERSASFYVIARLARALKINLSRLVGR